MGSQGLKEVLVIGGTGAQGLPVVHSLSKSGVYSARVLTRDPNSRRAQEISKLPNVICIQGAQDNQKDLHRAFTGVWDAWVNTDGFTLGEKSETFYGIRVYEIARYHKLQHYVYAATDYAVKDCDWDEEYHWAHNDAKGRVADYILAQGSEGDEDLVYMDMLSDGMFVPAEQEDGSFVWANPAKDREFPLIALEDIDPFSFWLLTNPSESVGLQLKVATDEVSFADIAATFTAVTGIPASHHFVFMETYLPMAESYPNAMTEWAAGPDTPRDESTMTFKEEFPGVVEVLGRGEGGEEGFCAFGSD